MVGDAYLDVTAEDGLTTPHIASMIPVAIPGGLYMGEVVECGRAEPACFLRRTYVPMDNFLASAPV